MQSEHIPALRLVGIQESAPDTAEDPTGRWKPSVLLNSLADIATCWVSQADLRCVTSDGPVTRTVNDRGVLGGAFVNRGRLIIILAIHLCLSH